jgi:two-component system CheB/CheR fusion protein
VRYLDVVIQPLWQGDDPAIGTALSFVDTTARTRLAQEVSRTREDLETAYAELQSTNEELETTNEELLSSIEELETTSEELQSTNEELETTNEELQSGNVELETLSEETRVRGAKDDQAHAYLENVLSSVAAGVVVLDARLRVRSWNRGAEDLWGLRAGEVYNKPFFGLRFGLPTDSVDELIHGSMSAGARAGHADVDATNRIGDTITCSLTCSPLNGEEGGVVLLMQVVTRD